MRLTGQVGNVGPNKIHDIAVVQAALMNIKPRSSNKPYWPGPIDGKKTNALTEAIKAFQVDNNIKPANGTVPSFGPTLSKLKNALSMGMRDLMALEKTAIVYVPVMGEREGEKEAAETIKRAPFPNREAKSIAFVQKTVGKKLGLCLVRDKDSITNDGRFQTELSFEGVKWIDPRSGNPMSPGREPANLNAKVGSLIKGADFWTLRTGSDLLYTSVIQLRSLKNTGQPQQDDLAALGLTIAPTNKILQALVVGCARLIKGKVRPARVGGQPEHIQILQAAEGIDKKVADAMRKAANEIEQRKGLPQLARGRGATFDSIDEAAIDGLLFCAGENRRTLDERERGGDIRLEQGKYIYDDIQTGPRAGRSVGVKTDSRTLAWFHTHPRLTGMRDRKYNKDGEVFSICDQNETENIANANGREIFGYMGTTLGAILKISSNDVNNDITLRGVKFLKYK